MSAVLQIDPIVRPMTLADLPVIAALDAQCYAFPWTLGNFADSLHSGYRCCVYEYNQTIIGYAVMMLIIDEAHLLNITIAPDSQGQGWGRKLMDHVIMRAQQDHVHWLWLEVRPSNGVAKKLYESMKFEFVAVRKNYYPAVDGREDAVIMRLALNHDA
ncbi:ribosomal protein S18-alanine N-acetyltransferase [Sulfuriferula nivalis]|uniref:[Ribosomal protein bS18]-alanine N-acetyltransferase n=1 Tax=Sulfuriferula nivalis TaxID=2675298 RepID=A0A809RNQ2_9PROT|nr:ribosomal protein S18-alanine N-acetyltransferase [Sulfuriferula nivalis]BBP00441.1 ribosomal-protein-alanine acetyltransferase [Sulfuriferula nivalis]